MGENISGYEDLKNRAKRIVAKNNISFVWMRFVNAIHYNNRFFPSDEIISCLEKLTGYCENLPKDTKLYRARIVSPEDYCSLRINKETIEESGLLGLSIEKMGAPPNNKAASGRANPAGISYLYLASDEATACAEVQPTLSYLISVAKFQVQSDLRILNLYCVQPTEDDELNAFTEKVMIAFSEPNRNPNDIEYAATQFIASYMQKNGFDGIKYISSHNYNEKSYSIVLFEPTKAVCVDKNGMVFKMLNSKLVFQNISLFGKQLVEASSGIDYIRDDNILVMKDDLRRHIEKMKKDNI